MVGLRVLAYRILHGIYKYFCILFRSQKYPLIKNVSEAFADQRRILPAGWVQCKFPEVYNLQRAFSGDFYMNELVIYSIPNASISHNSDLVLTDKGCFWEKSFRNDFSAEVPLDTPLFKYNTEEVLVRKYKKEVFIDGVSISLVGVHSHIWAHFVVSYLPKLYYAGENGYLNDRITLLTPKYGDAQLREMIYEYISEFPLVNWIEIAPNCDYKCERLLYMPSLCVLGDHSDYILPSMGIFPPIVGQLLKEHLIDHFSQLASNCASEIAPKLFIVRRSAYRTIMNNSELEHYFELKGFKMIDPGRMSFIEKVSLFSNADVIVGPLSGGFINTLFCKKGAKILGFSTLPRTIESYLPFIQSISGFDLLLVTGEDYSRTIHPDYYVPIERITAAYDVLMSR